MTLYDKKKENQQSVEGTIVDSNALNTEEIISILSKTNNVFVKESEISLGVSKLFKKKNLKDFAKNSGNHMDSEKNISEKKENVIVEEDNNNIEKKVKEEARKEKNYSENEVKKIANEVANKNYYKGYDEGIKKIKSELEQGDKALALSLKNLTDGLFSVSPEFSNKINENVSLLISRAIREILGTEIDRNAKILIDKVKNLADTVFNELKNIVVFLNHKDFESINKYLEQNKIKLNISFEKDEKLHRGDLILKSGTIEVKDIMSNIKFSGIDKTEILTNSSLPSNDIKD
tara:strand:+ start:25 stop:894 length:870 start_codon:yes stop_codon:yes gene_type:complete